MRSAAIQPKLKISTPQDKYEREADRIADEVMRKPEKNTGDETSAPTPIRTSTIHASQSFGIGPPVTPTIQSEIQSLQGSGGERLPKHRRGVVEPRLGHDLSAVRVHRDSVAHEVAKGLQARALTIGNHIIFGKGQYPAGNEANSRLLTHELVHTVQQMQGTHPLIQRAPVVVNVGAPEEGLKSAPAEDLIEGGTDLDKQLYSLSQRIRELLHNVFGEPGPTADEVWAALFPRRQFSEARRAAESYRLVTNELAIRTLDVAFAAQWLEVAISTLNAVSAPLNQVARSGNTQAPIAKALARETHSILNAARKVQKNPMVVRGSSLGAKATAKAKQTVLKKGLAKITSDTQRQTVGMSDTAIDIKIQELQSQKILEIDPVKIQVLEAMTTGLRSGKVEGRGSSEPSFSERADDLVKQADENWVRLAQKVVDHYSDNERNLFIVELVFERIPEDDKAEFSRAFYDAITNRVDAEQKFQLLQETRSGRAILAAVATSADLDFDFFNARSALGLDVSEGLANREISEKASSLLAEVTPRKAPALSLTLPETADLAVDVAVPGLGVHEVAIVTGSTAINVEGPVDGIFLVTVAPSDLKAVGVTSPVNPLEATDTVRIFLPKQRRQVVIPVSQLGKFVKGERVKALISAVEAASLAAPGPPLAPAAKAVVSPLLRAAGRLGAKAPRLGRKLGEPLLAGVLHTGLPVERLGTRTATRAPVEAVEKAAIREVSGRTYRYPGAPYPGARSCSRKHSTASDYSISFSPLRS